MRNSFIEKECLYSYSTRVGNSNFYRTEADYIVGLVKDYIHEFLNESPYSGDFCISVEWEDQVMYLKFVVEILIKGPRKRYYRTFDLDKDEVDEVIFTDDITGDEIKTIEGIVNYIILGITKIL